MAVTNESGHSDDQLPPAYRQTGAAPGAYESPTASEQIEVWLDILYRRKWLVLLVLVVSIGAAAAYAYTRVSHYRSQTLVMVDLSSGGMSSNQGQQYGNAQTNLFATNDRTLSGELFLIQNSNAVAKNVADRLLERAREGRLDRDLSILFDQARDTLSREQVMERLSGYVSFSSAHSDVNAMSISATSRVPGEASLLTNLFAEEYVSLTREESRAHLVSKRKYLESQKQKWQANLRSAEQRIQEFMMENGVMGENVEGANLATKIADLEARREEARIDLQMRRSTLQALEQRLNQLSSGLADQMASGSDQLIQALQGKISELKVTKQGILLDNPDLRGRDTTIPRLENINQQIAQLQHRVDSLSRRYVSRIDSAGTAVDGSGAVAEVVSLRQRIREQRMSIQELQSRIDMITRQLEEQQTRMQELPEQKFQLAQLQRTQAYAEQMHQLVVERLQDVRVAEESETGYARILQRASAPGTPVRPNKFRYLFLGCLLGLLGGIGVAYFFDSVDTRIYKPDQATEEGERLIGVIPSMNGYLKNNRGNKKLAEHDGRNVDASLVPMYDPDSPIGEAYRHIRTRLRYGFANKDISSVAVTSPNTKEGKSVTASNLAISMAQSGRRTLLVDADLRRPRIHQLFNIDIDDGLFQLWDNSIGDRFIKEVDDNLFVVTAGQIVENAAELLGTDRMAHVIGQMKKYFDFVVVDTPPVLAVTDAAIVSTYCDATLLIARAGHTKKAEASEALENLREVDARIVGMLLNDFDLSMAYGYRYKYGKYTRNGYYGSEEEGAIVQVGVSDTHTSRSDTQTNL